MKRIFLIAIFLLVSSQSYAKGIHFHNMEIAAIVANAISTAKSGLDNKAKVAWVLTVLGVVSRSLSENSHKHRDCSDGTCSRKNKNNVSKYIANFSSLSALLIPIGNEVYKQITKN